MRDVMRTVPFIGTVMFPPYITNVLIHFPEICEDYVMGNGLTMYF